MGVQNRLARSFYWPLCRMYARHVVRDEPADRVFAALSAVEYRRRVGDWPNLGAPRRFSEKLWCRMLFARDPILAVLSDKLSAREYIAAKAGAQFTVPFLWAGTELQALRSELLPDRFVVKANFGSGRNLFVSGQDLQERLMALGRARKWLLQVAPRHESLGTEWGYRNIKPALIVEPYLGEEGVLPLDYKFYCFCGHVEFVTIHYDRLGEHRTRTVDCRFGPCDVHTGRPQWQGACRRPENFEAMVEVAERLSAEFNFMRIDLYNVKGRIYCGEITPYPLGAAPTFYPPARDAALGELWPGDARTVYR